MSDGKQERITNRKISSDRNQCLISFCDAGTSLICRCDRSLKKRLGGLYRGSDRFLHDRCTDAHLKSNGDRSSVQYNPRSVCRVGSHKVSVQREKTAHDSDRCPGHGVTDHCRSYLSSDLWKAEYSLSLSAKSGYSDCFCSSGNCSCHHICYFSVCFSGTSSSTGSNRNG